MHQPLTAADLLPDGPLRRLGTRVIALPEMPSTNTHLLDQAADLADGTIAVTDYQTHGRGRQGRRWLAPRGASILLSVLLHEPSASRRLKHAALLAALAAAEAIEEIVDLRPALRWPNDLTLNNRKLAGVLAESCQLAAAAESSGIAAAEPNRRVLVVGVGINCLQQAGHFAPELADQATSLEIESADPIDRAALARALVYRLDQYFAANLDAPDAWSAFRSAWRDRCEDIGTRVTLVEDARRFTGTVIDIDDNADLVVELDSAGRRHFSAATTTRQW